jgi:uncharacterized Zn-binding protein involved in type VI secretion
MSISKARAGDQAVGTCVNGGSPFIWTGTVSGGSSDVLVNGVSDARLGDQVVTNCPACTRCTIVGGSVTVLSNGIGTSRFGETVTGPSGANGTIITGSGDVLAGG